MALTGPFYLIAGLALLAGCVPEVAQCWRLERDAIKAGEYWRLMTAHLASVTPGHGLANLAALIGIASFQRQALKPIAVFLLISAPVLSLIIVAWMPLLQWYAGLSGLLYGLLVFRLSVQRQCWAWTGVAAVALYLAWQAAHPGWVGHVPVAWQVHGIGAFMGLVASGLGGLAGFGAIDDSAIAVGSGHRSRWAGRSAAVDSSGS